MGGHGIVPGRDNGAMRMHGLMMAVLLAGGMAGQEWTPLFDGKSLMGWKETPFTGRGKVAVRDGTIELGKGLMTGITWTGEFPRAEYEIRWEAARLAGKDFFASLTFPVNDSYCAWISGGWDGTVVGLSSLDGNDASENDTSAVRDFETGRWYSFRLAVSGGRVRAWIDGAVVIDVDVSKRKVGLAFDELDMAVPVGFTAYATTGGVRNVAYRRLEEPAGR